MKTTEKTIYNFLLNLTNVFEISKSETELAQGLQEAFKTFGDIKEFKVFLFDDVLNSLKDFTKPWETLKQDYLANILNSYFCSFKYNNADFIKEKDTLAFPVFDENRLTGLVYIKGNIKNKILFEILPLVSRQISFALQNLKNSEEMMTQQKFHKTIRNIAKIIETQYELNYIMPVLGEMIDSFITEHLIYVFLKNPKKKDYKLVWPNNCSDTRILNYLSVINQKSTAILEDGGKIGIFPLFCEGKIFGAIVAKSGLEKLNNKDTDYLIEISKQASTTVERACSYMKILEHATLDALTGLNNRHQFHTRLHSEVANAKRQKSSLCCIMTDIDFFKSVNDTYGHAVGDCVLKTVAKAIKKELREYDIPSRYGGEEFTILLPNTSLEEATVVAERLRAQIEKKTINIEDYRIEGVSNISVTISVGVSQYKNSMAEPDELYRSADGALYEAKESGRNRVIVAK